MYPLGMLMRVLALTTVLVAVVSAQQSQQPSRIDLLLRNAHVFDGNGNPWIRADVAVTGDRIQAVGKLEGVKAAKTIDANGLALTPGFIDVHSHAGEGLATDELRHGQPVLAQGITTVLVNPDGGGPLDLAEQREQYSKH